MILVTGGTGMVGSHLLYKLVSANKKVRATYRRAHKIDTVKRVFSYYTNDVETLFNNIEWVEANINDVPALELDFKDIDFVYHCAAFISFEPDKYHQLRKINIEGTANIVNLCISNAVKKLCYVSSIAAIGHNENADELIDETTDWNPEEDNNVYAITKYGAEMEVWRSTQEGLDAVVVNPGIILGPGYWKSGGSGSLFKQIYKGMKYYTTGITGYVDIWDVVDTMFQLMESTIKNEGYILVSENLSFKDFQSKAAKALGVKVSKKEASPLLLAIAWRMDWLNHKLFGKRRQLSKQIAKTAHTKSVFDASKIKFALNFEFKSIDKSVEEVSRLFLKDHKS